MNKYAVIALLLIISIIPASSTTYFAEDFSNGTKGAFTGCSASITFPIVDGTNVAYFSGTTSFKYCYIQGLNFSDFRMTNDMYFSSNGGYFLTYSFDDPYYDYSIYLTVFNTTGSYYSNEGLMTGSQIWIQYYDNSLNEININDHTINFTPYRIGNKTKVGFQREGTNFKLFANDIQIASYTNVAPKNSLNEIYNYQIGGYNTHDTLYIDNILLTSIPIPIIPSTCSQLDLSGISWYDLPSLTGAILSWLYSAPSCFYQSFIDWMYTFLEDVFYIPNGILNSFLWNINRVYFDFIGSIHAISNLMTNVTNMLENSVYFMIDNAWAGIIATGFTLVISLRIYSFLKDISIAGFKI